ncbi:NAD-dependent epimerase/dehydratase family protein [Sulfurimonas sp.]|uniref:NAD-dependent epimerase/dehydratase family protein n=1 Tax=Sulfurimonas sp. TaxID=2022749 RepID=UPI002B467A2C|nr:NAD-dependent epimerase/dehydratase family protein [Sulfurimonas sp.]
MYNILISGGAGFIGTALAKKLLTLNYKITIIDLENKFSSIHNEFDSYILDIIDYKNFEILKGKNYDIIFHLAAQTSSVISQEEPTLDVDTNVKGTLNICNFARECNAKKIVFASSMATYGNVEGKITEQSKQIPLSNYGVSKVSGEYYINMYNQFGIKNTIFRLFNVYGPGQDMSNLRQGMASIFMAQSITSNEIKVTGSFDRYRDFVYIDDVVEAIILGIDEKTDSSIYNVGSEKATTVAELLDLILEINDKPKGDFKVINIGSHDGDQFGSISDSSKLLELGWKADVSLLVGMKNMYMYAKKVLL